MSRVRLQIDFEIPQDLIGIYADSTHCEFVGEKDGPYSLEKAAEMLNKYASTKMYGNNERHGIMKIFHDDELVGFSMPRVIHEKEHKVFKLETDLTYHRIGTVYIDPKHRGKGIMKETIKEFLKVYPNLVWTCNEENIGSHKAALSGGLQFSHKVYVRDRLDWHFEPVEGLIRVDNIYTSRN